MKAVKWLCIAYFALSVFSIGGSAYAKQIHFNAGAIASICSVLLILCGAGCVAACYKNWQWLAGLLVICTFIELVGVSTGFPFGRYIYTDQWWPAVNLGSLGFFPLVLPFSWLLIAGSSNLVARKLSSGWPAIPVTGLITAFIDWPMEDVMTHHFHYWTWISTGPLFGAPLSNSVGWFMVGCAAAYLLQGTKAHLQNSYGAIVLFLFCMVIAFTALINGLATAPHLLVISFAILGLSMWRPWRLTEPQEGGGT